MKKNKLNKRYSIKETVALYTFACTAMYEKNEEINIRNVVENIIITMKNTKKEIILEKIDIDTLKIIPFNWEFSSYEVVSYAFAIFYVLVNRKEKLTEERIIKEMLNELFSHNPKRTLKEAEFIAKQVFPELDEEID